MENFKGTSAPWEIYVRNGRGSTYFSIENDNVRICNINSKRTEQFEEEEANAQLIAHAPEMLEAIQSFVNGFESDYVLDDGTIVDNPYEWLVVEYHKCKDLLTRATTI